MQDHITTHESKTENHAENHLEFERNPSPTKRSSRRVGMVLLGIGMLVTAGVFGIHQIPQHNSNNTGKAEGRGKGKRRQGPPVVTVAKATQKTIPVQLQAIGNVQAESTVSVTPQVSGVITGVFFKKGQEVKKGQLLFTLDDRTQQAAIQQAQGTLARDLALVQQYRATLGKDLTLVKQAQANLAKDEAQAQLAQAQAGRYDQLYRQGAVSKDQAQQYSTSRQATAATLLADKQAIANAQAATKVDEAAIENAQGVVKADEGTLRNAQVQLSYTKIYAPITGRAGNVVLTPGNVVQPSSAGMNQGNTSQTNSTALVTISQIRPIQIAFSVPEANLPNIQKYMQNNKLTVEATVPNSNTPPIRGTLYSVNNTVDNTTGTIQLLGEFSNPQGQLWPGQYVNTTLTLATIPNATVVPSQAVQNGPNGQFVFIVKPDKTVQNVPVAIGSTINGFTVINKGIQPGQTVVTDGQANLISGNKVEITKRS